MGLADEFSAEMAKFITENEDTKQLLSAMTKQNAFVTVILYLLAVGAVTDVCIVQLADRTRRCYRKRNPFVCRSEEHIKIQSEFFFDRSCVVSAQSAQLCACTVKSCIYKKRGISSALP